MIIVTPTFFTIREGGKWLPCPADCELSKATLDYPRPDPERLQEGDPIDPATPIFQMPHNGKVYFVYSMAFGDVNTHSYPRWDTYNGWTRPLPAEYQHEH